MHAYTWQLYKKFLFRDLFSTGVQSWFVCSRGFKLYLAGTWAASCHRSLLCCCSIHSIRLVILSAALTVCQTSMYLIKNLSSRLPHFRLFVGYYCTEYLFFSAYWCKNVDLQISTSTLYHPWLPVQWGKSFLPVKKAILLLALQII